MVPEVVRLERAGVCGCGELVEAGERAGYATQQARVVCLGCLERMSAESAPEEASRASALLPAVWTADERVIAATLNALRGESSPAWHPSEPAVLHVPTEWSSPRFEPPRRPEEQGTESPEPWITLPRRKPRTEPLPGADVSGPTDTPGPTSDLPAAPDLTAADPAVLPEPVRVVLPEPVRVVLPEPVRVTLEAGLPTAAETDTRRSRHEAAAIEDARMPAPVQRRRAGLFTRLLTVRTFRSQQAQPKVSKSQAAVSALLDAATAKGVLSLHNRRVPGRRGRIEHIAVGAAGIYVIDVLHFKNASIEVRPAGDDAGTDDLVVGGRVMTAAVRAVAQRVEVLRLILVAAGLENVPVTGALCFVDGLLPLSVADLQVGGMHVLRPNGLTALVAGSGAFGPEDRATLHEFFTERLPAVA